MLMPTAVFEFCFDNSDAMLLVVPLIWTGRAARRDWACAFTDRDCLGPEFHMGHRAPVITSWRSFR